MSHEQHRPAPPVRLIGGVAVQGAAPIGAALRSESTQPATDRPPAGAPHPQPAAIAATPTVPRRQVVPTPHTARPPAQPPTPRAAGFDSGGYAALAPAMEVPRAVTIDHADFIAMVGHLDLRPPLAERDLFVLAQMVFRCAAAEGRHMIAEGQAAEHAFYLIAGRADVSHQDHARGAPFDRLEAGAFFGEGAVLGDPAHKVTITAGPGCVVFAFSRQALRRTSPYLVERLRSAFAAQRAWRLRHRQW